MSLVAKRTYEQVVTDIIAAHTAGALKARLLLDQVSGTFTDSSGNGNDAIAQIGVTFEQGPLRRGSGGGESAGFTSDRITVASSTDFDVGTTMTLSIWLKTSTVTNQGLICRDSAGSDGFYFRTVPTTGYISYDVGGSMKTGSVNVSDGNIHHAVLVCDGVNSMLYIDGVLVQSSAFSASIRIGTNNEVNVGSQRTSGTFDYTGQLGDAQFWDEAWTPQEVAEAYAAGIRYLNSQYDDEEAAWDAEHGAATFFLKLDDPTVVVDEIASDTVAFVGSPLVDVFNAIGTVGELAMNCDGVNDACSLGTGAVKPGDDTTFHHRFWFKGDAVTSDKTIVEGFENSGQGFGFRVLSISSGASVRLRMRFGETDETTVDVAVDITSDDWHMCAFGYRPSDKQIFLRVDLTESTATLGGTFDNGADAVLLGEDYNSVFEPIAYSRYRCYARYPAAGELNRMYDVGRSFVFNIDTTASNNPDYTTKAAALSDYTAISTVSNLTHWFEFDYNIVSASVIDFLPAASTSTAAWESASRRLKAFVSPISWANLNQTDPASKGLIQFTGTQQDLTTFVIQPTAIPFARVEGFVIDTGTAGHAGSVLANAAVGAEWVRCRLTHDGDFTSPTNDLNFIDSKSGKDVTLTNSIIELNNDDQGGSDPGVAKGAGTVNFTHTTIVQLGTETAIDAKPSTGTITNTFLGKNFADTGDTGDCSVYQDTTEVKTDDEADTLNDVSLFDYRVFDGGISFQSGAALTGVFADAFGTDFTVAASPNVGHFNTTVVGGGSGGAPSGVGLVAGPSSIPSSSSSSFKPTQEHLFNQTQA